ncbi:MAG: hypothetical protein HWE25_11320 [Alphaproteobacteria bacterium]|nr:hypothetical protein [Alphaproteobacteria bacterium]
MLRILSILVFLGAISMGEAHVSAQPARVGASGQPIPRLISLAASKAYMRTGPGRQYPIEWVYRRSHLPLEVVDEHGAWRQVRDHEGITGWMHVSLLSPRRTAIIIGETRKLYAEPDPSSRLRITAEPSVVGEISRCEGIWCKLEIDDTEGWIERRYIWGVYPNETIK